MDCALALVLLSLTFAIPMARTWKSLLHRGLLNAKTGSTQIKTLSSLSRMIMFLKATYDFLS